MNKFKRLFYKMPPMIKSNIVLTSFEKSEIEQVAKRINRYAKIVPYFVGASWLIALIMIVVILKMVFVWK